MHILIATDGTLDVAKTADTAARLAGPDGKVTVYTVIEVPRGLLNEMRAAAGDSADAKAREVGAEYRSTQAADPPVSHWAGDDAVVDRYVKSKVDRCTSELAAALEAAGIEHTVVGEEGENAAQSVLVAARTREADFLCIGTHGLGRFEGLLGSTSTKIARLAPCSVVLVR